MTEQIITSSVLIVSVWLVSFLWERQINPCVKYALWLLVAVKLLVPLPEFGSGISVMNVVNQLEERNISYRIEENSGADENKKNTETADNEALEDGGGIAESPAHIRERDVQNAQERVHPEVDAGDICRGIWVTGMILCGGVLLWSNLKFAGNLRRSRVCVGRVRDALDVYEVPGISSPCLFGLLKPAVYLPEGCALSQEQKNYVLVHEYVHYRHKDHIWALIRCMCMALYWYNPLVWLAASASIRDGELACDAGTLKLIGRKNRIKYGKALVGIAEGTRRIPSGFSILRCSTGASGGGRGMKKRLQMIIKQPRTKKTALPILLLLCALIVGCTFGNAETGSFINGSAAAVNIAAGSAAAKETTDRINEETDGGEGARKESVQPGQETAPDFENMLYRGVTLTRQLEKDKVCIEVQPSVLREYVSYYYIPSGEEQERLQELAAGLLTGGEGFSGDFKGRKETGWRLCYQGRSFMAFEDGSLYCMYTDETEGNEDYLVQNTELYDYVRNMLRIRMGYEPFDPAEIKNIVSATLNVSSISTDWKFYSQTITDKDMLAMFEDWFGNAKYIFGGADCGNEDACLELTLEDGRTVRLSVATDSCPDFGINGVYYDYRPASVWDNREFFGCFDEIPWDFK